MLMGTTPFHSKSKRDNHKSNHWLGCVTLLLSYIFEFDNLKRLANYAQCAQVVVTLIELTQRAKVLIYTKPT